MVIDPKPQIKIELERDLAPLREKLAAATDKVERREIKRDMRALKREASRRMRSAVW